MPLCCSSHPQIHIQTHTDVTDYLSMYGAGDPVQVVVHEGTHVTTAIGSIGL